MVKPKTGGSDVNLKIFEMLCGISHPIKCKLCKTLLGKNSSVKKAMDVFNDVINHFKDKHPDINLSRKQDHGN